MPKTNPMLRSALLLTGVNLLLRFAGTGFQVWLSAALGAAGVGLLQLTLSVGSLALVAGTAGIRTAAMYLTAAELGRNRPGNVKWVLSGCFVYAMVCSGAVSILLYVLAPTLARDWIGDVRTTDALRLFAATLPLSCLCGVMTGYFTAANRIATLAAVEICEQLCAMAVTCLCLTVWAGEDPGRACMSVIAGSAAGAMLTLGCLTALRLGEKTPPGPKIPVAARLCRTAAPLALGDVLKSGINTAENLMVPRRLALCPGIDTPLAAFGILSGMVFPVLMFPAGILFALAELLIPELARCAAAGHRRRIAYLVRRALKVALLYGLIFGGAMVLGAEALCLRLYGSAQAGQALQRYALLIPMLYCDALTDAMTKGLGQQTACVRYNILTSALDVGLLYLLLPRWGMDGYFVSFLVTHALNFLLSLRRLLKISGVALPFYVPALGVSCALASGWAAGYAGPLIFRLSAYLSLLFASLYLTRIWGKEDLRWLKGLIQKK